MSFPPSHIGAIAADLWRSRGRGVKNAFARRAPGQPPARWIVFDSDDWGSQRVPSSRALARLAKAGVIGGDGAYDRDTLESASDLAALYEVLAAARGGDGRPPVVSAYVNPANPDFDAIRANGFAEYCWEPMSATLARRGDARETIAAWRTGVAEGLLVPQYHGREHLQVRAWMEQLAHDGPVRAGFEHGYYSVALPGVPDALRGFRAANFFRSLDELPDLGAIIASGADCFEAEFGRRPDIYCPTNNIFHPALYPAVRAAGCRALVRHVRNKQPDGRGGLRLAWGQGGVTEAGLAWHGRNATFEPVQGFGVDHALAGIASAFAWGVPAVISTHRVNFVGGVDPAQRDRGLQGLRDLLAAIARLWPDACYVPSTALTDPLAG